MATKKEFLMAKFKAMALLTFTAKETLKEEMEARKKANQHITKEEYMTLIAERMIVIIANTAPDLLADEL